MNSDFFKNSMTGNKIIVPRSKINYENLAKQIHKQLEPQIEEIMAKLQSAVDQMNEAIMSLDESFARSESEKMNRSIFGGRSNGHGTNLDIWSETFGKVK